MTASRTSHSLRSSSVTTAIAAAVRQIVELPEEDWLAWRQRCLDAAHDRYNWETQVEALLAEYGRLTGKPW